MSRMKIKEYLNRGISTPVAIFVISSFILVMSAAILWEVKFGCEEWFKGTLPPASILAPSPSPVPSEPYIKIIYPNGGEEWEIGKTYTIRWKSIGIEWINIELKDAISLNSYYLNKEPISAESESYTFKVEKFISMSGATGRISFEPINLVSSDKYIIDISKIPYELYNEIEDNSDNYFSVAHWDKDTCAKEGEQVCDWSTCKFCCPGLMDVQIKTPVTDEYNEIACEVLGGTVSNFCIKCGDGVCRDMENWCVCPQDCKKLTPEGEIADWKIYENESFGLSFKYPSSYQIIKGNNESIQINKINQGLVLSDTLRSGHPQLTLGFNPDGVGGICLCDIRYFTVIKQGKIEIVSRLGGDRIEEEICRENFDITKKIIWVDIGQYSWGEEGFKNGIIMVFEFERSGPDYKQELEQIIETIKIAKEDIYGPSQEPPYE